MIIKKTTLFLSAIITIAASPINHAKEDDKPRIMVKSAGKSKGEFVFIYLVEHQATEFPKSQVIILKDEKVLNVITDASPVSFNPDGDILLMKEIGGDDDLQHYILNLGGGEYKKEQARKDYVFGGRWATNARWNEDGTKVLLHLHMTAEGEDDEVSYSVKDLIAKSKNSKTEDKN